LSVSHRVEVWHFFAPELSGLALNPEPVHLLMLRATVMASVSIVQPATKEVHMTGLTATFVGLVLGYRVQPLARAFLLTLGSIVLVLIPQTILLWNTERHSIDAAYLLVQIAIVGVAYLTTRLGAWIRTRRSGGDHGRRGPWSRATEGVEDA